MRVLAAGPPWLAGTTTPLERGCGQRWGGADWVGRGGQRASGGQRAGHSPPSRSKLKGTDPLPSSPAEACPAWAQESSAHPLASVPAQALRPCCALTSPSPESAAVPPHPPPSLGAAVCPAPWVLSCLSCPSQGARGSGQVSPKCPKHWGPPRGPGPQCRDEAGRSGWGPCSLPAAGISPGCAGAHHPGLTLHAGLPSMHALPSLQLQASRGSRTGLRFPGRAAPVTCY